MKLIIEITDIPSLKMRDIRKLKKAFQKGIRGLKTDGKHFIGRALSNLSKKLAK